VSRIDLRPLTRDDLPAVCALHNRSELFDGVQRKLTLDELEEELDDDQIVLATDTRLALLDGEPAGYAYTILMPSSERLERCYVEGETDPVHRRKGVGSALMEWAVARGTEQLRTTGNPVEKYLRVDSYDFIETSHRLYARFGFEPVRWFEELLRPLTDLPPPPAVRGVRVEPWPAGHDEETLRVVKNTAFADHWGSTPTTPTNWHQHLHGQGSRPDLSFVAVDDATGEPVAVCINHRYPSDDEVVGRSDGWIMTLGTLAPWRGRGVASALVIASLHAFAAAGLTHASIGVDGDSPTGAARLYRSLGFEHVHRSITSQISIA
jgi:GNAT superfamily N-acetyltransferase